MTGAASGIGRATALRLADDSWSVAAVDRDEAALESLLHEARLAPGRVEAVIADLVDPDVGAGVVKRALELGSIAALVNVAGVMVPDDTVEALADADLDRLLAVNVSAIFRLGRAVIPELRRRGGGVIVNTTSVHAFATMDRCAGYAATKGAILALTRAMAIDLAPDGIRVVAVAPGSVDTPLTRAELARRGQDAAEAGFSTDEHGLGRVLAPTEIAEVVAWLVSPRAAALSGTTVVADAGLLSRLV